MDQVVPQPAITCSKLIMEIPEQYNLLTFTCSKSKIETLEKGVRYVQI